MYKVKVNYSVILTYPTLEEAQRAQKMLFEGGVEEVAIIFEPIEEEATAEEV